MIKVEKEKARRYWKNPTLLLPSVAIKISENGTAAMVDGALLAPENEKLVVFVWQFTEPITGMEFVRVSGGCFQMGSPSGEAGRDDDEGPVHKVCVDGFWMGKYEVTRAQWRKLMGNNPSKFKKDDNYPVEGISWNDSQKFIKKLNRQSGKTFRLPTEAEWEYACRAGTTTRYSWGDTFSCEKAMCGNRVDSSADSCVDYVKSRGLIADCTAPVGSYPMNAFGLYDMSGNVWECCADKYGKYYYANSPVNNPQGPASGALRVIRGGCWSSWPPARVRAANRIRYSSDYRSYPYDRIAHLGFRLVLSSGQE